MLSRASYFVGAVSLLLGLSGCPVTDDYYLMSSQAENGHGGEAALGGSNGGGSASDSSGSASGGTATMDQGGSLAAGGAPLLGGGGSLLGGGGSSAGSGGDTSSTTAGTSTDPGMAGAPAAGAPAEGGASGEPGCVASPEVCNGRDDDCNDVIDDFACDDGCSGFVLTDPEHGYMMCAGNPRHANWYNAQTACDNQGEELVQIDSAAENDALSARIRTLTSDPAFYIGGSDAAKEGDWHWVGGDAFWKGNGNGSAVDDAFEAWDPANPDNQTNQDCAVLKPAEKSWDDRTCSDIYAYICEAN
jgi:hypothetical protein